MQYENLKVFTTINEENSQLKSIEMLYLMSSNISSLFDCGFFKKHFILLLPKLIFSSGKLIFKILKHHDEMFWYFLNFLYVIL